MFLLRIFKLILVTATLAAILLGLVVSSSYPTQKSQDSDPSHAHRKPKDASRESAEASNPQRGAGHRRMLQLLNEIAASGAREHPFMGDGRAQELSRQLAELDARSAQVPPTPLEDVNRWQVLLDLGIAELRLGRLEAGTGHLLAAYQLLPKIKPHVKKMIFELCVGYLRFGETLNCALQHNAESCLLPLRGKGIHTLPEGSTKAVRYFTEVLENTSSDEVSGYHYPALWLLNIAQMTL